MSLKCIVAWRPYQDGPTVSEEEDNVTILSAEEKFMQGFFQGGVGGAFTPP